MRKAGGESEFLVLLNVALEILLLKLCTTNILLHLGNERI